MHDNTNNLAHKTTVDYGEGEVTGRMYGYGFTVQLYNNISSEDENPYSKGLKGIEYPEGEISFDINLKLERSKFGSEKLEDITLEAMPILWNYRENDWNLTDLSGNIENRNMYNSSGYTIYDKDLPLGILNKDRYYSTYNSGNINIEQSGSILHVTINDYEFDGEFPMYNCVWDGTIFEDRTKIYTENIGTFCVGYIQIFVPDTEASTIGDRNYYLTVSDNNMKIQSNTQGEISKQMNTKDDLLKIQHVLYKKGIYGQTINIYNEKREVGSIESSWGTGDGKVNIGDTIAMDFAFLVKSINDSDIYSANKFIKFDGQTFEPIYYEDGDKYKTSGMYGNAEFKLWYVTKKDGTNWVSQDEMNNTNIEDMDIYDNIEDIPDDKLCVGIYAETISGYISRASNNNLNLLFKIRESSEIGKTYGITQRTWYWLEELDRSKYTIENKEIEYIKDWPKTEWDSGNLNYIKTEYDESGQIIAGTHSGGAVHGNTVLVVGA